MECDVDEKKPEKLERRRGPTASQISWGVIVSVLSLAASGIATYSTLQNDIASLKRAEVYQERTNDRLSEEIRAVRIEQRESMRELSEKLDRIIESWPRNRR